MPKLITPQSFRFCDLPRHVDVVIVGGGFTGLQFAAELWSAGVSSVMVIEAGPINELQHHNLMYDGKEAEELWLGPEKDHNFWRPWKSLKPPHFTGRSGLRRLLGGRSLYWQGITIPIEDWAMQEPWWPKEIIDILTKTWQNGPSLYEQVLEDIGFWRILPDTAGGSNDLSQKFFHALGLHGATVTPAMVRHHYIGKGEIRVAAYSPIELFTEYVGNSAPLPMLSCESMVTGILLNRNRVKGVKLVNIRTGALSEISCEYAILAAGTVENTRLALQTKFLSDDSSPIARGLVDHIVQGFVVRVAGNDFDEELIEEIQPGPVYLICRDEQIRSNFFMAISRDNELDFIIDVWAMGEQMPQSCNYIVCKPTINWPWVTQVKSDLAGSDNLVLEGQQRVCNELWASIRLLLNRKEPDLNFPDFINSESTLLDATRRVRSGKLEYYTPLTWASPLGTVDHEGGTLAYGHTLDINGEFHNIKNLYAIGACSFPRLGAANPALTNLALIRNVATRILAKLA